MKCPNIWCISREYGGECNQHDCFCLQCELRIKYEADFCPDEEEYNRNIKKLIDGKIELPF